MLRRFGLILGLALVLGLAVFFVWHPIPSAIAQTPTTFTVEPIGSQLGVGEADLKQTIINILKWVLGILSLVAVSFLIYGGVLWMTAAGREQQVEKAKRVILQALIGMVIVLLAWAIVLFVARSLTNATNGGPTEPGIPCNPMVEDCFGTGVRTFDITAINTCSEPPNYSANVPRASAVSIIFNASLNDTNTSDPSDPGSVEFAFDDKTKAPEAPNLVIEQCDNPDPANKNKPPCVGWITPDPISSQVFSGETKQGKAGSVKAEWVARDNTLTFYHESFSDVEGNPDNLWFQPNTTYRITVPSDKLNLPGVPKNPTALQDIASRLLQHCQRDVGVPIIGDEIMGDHCVEQDDRIEWIFTTGEKITGTKLAVTNTYPTSEYLTNSEARPDRNVNRQSIFTATFNTAIDPYTVNGDNIQIYKATKNPNIETGLDGEYNDPPLLSTDFTYHTPDGRTIQFGFTKPEQALEPFTWYKIVVKDIRDLCATKLENPYEWVFETNDKVRGVYQVYPANEFPAACPATRVFIQYNTSMWNIAGGMDDCSVGLKGTYVTEGIMSPSAGRVFNVKDNYNSADPNNSCTTFQFIAPPGPPDNSDPEKPELSPGTTYSVGVNSSLVIDSSGTKLNYGDTPYAHDPSQGPWHFTVADKNSCIQPPVITDVQAASYKPKEGPDGICLSVMGYYFEKVNEADIKPNLPDDGDALTYGDVIQGVRPNRAIFAWTNNSIVEKLDGGSLQVDANHDFQVGVKYRDPFNLVKGNLYPFRLSSDTSLAGPCLMSLNPNQGPVGTSVNATGENFGPPTGRMTFTRSVEVDWDLSGASWGDKFVNNARVSAASQLGEGNVKVITKAGAPSNPLPFEVKPTIGEAPRVEESGICDLKVSPPKTPSPNPRNGDNEACRNSIISARFTQDMDQGTLNTANIYLEKCISNVCAKIPGSIVTADRSFVLTPTGLLEPSTTYRMTIKGAVTNNVVPTPVLMGGDYVWQFTTKAGEALCQITNIVLMPPEPLVYQEKDMPLSHEKIAAPSDDACHFLVGNNITYSWQNTNPAVALIDSAVTSNKNTVVSPAPPIDPVKGTTEVFVKAEGKESNHASVTFDPLYCVNDDQCKTNVYKESCPGSKCIQNKCTMVFNGIEPPDGSLGTYVTFKGCWFDAYQEGVSKVTFTDNKDGLAPNTLICGSASATWENERIYREVPNRATPEGDDAVTGPTSVTRADGQTATGATFTVNSVDKPNICKVVPSDQFPAQPIAISGDRLGDKQEADDKVTITTLPPPGTTTDFTSYIANGWKDTEVSANVPDTATEGSNELRVINGGVSSNPLTFYVRSLDCTQSCNVDSSCPAGEGCGTDRCCHPRPHIIASRPAPNATDICPNTLIEVDFSQPLDPGTVNQSTVKYINNHKVVVPGLGVGNDELTKTGTVRISPGLMDNNSTQEIFFQPGIRSTKGVLADYSAGPVKSPIAFTTAPEICLLDHVAMTPTSHRFTAKYNGTIIWQKNYLPYYAKAYSNTNQLLGQISGVYNWDWNWEMGDMTIATKDGPYPGDYVNVLAQANGTTFVKATATVTEDISGKTKGQSRSGQGQVIVDFCENPWVFTDTAGNCNVGSCADYSFEMSYCRGNGLEYICEGGINANKACTLASEATDCPGSKCGTKLLPNFSYQRIEGINAQDTNRIKSYFFKQDKDSRDTIGILIYKNPDFLSPYDWFIQRFPNDVAGSSTVIDGYPAVRTGTTTYVGVTNQWSDRLEGLMFVFDYNSNNAQGSTVNIYSQILSKINFNLNGNSFDEPLILNDTRRRQDLMSMKLMLEAYKTKNSNYPSLVAGSYISGMSTSVWPSWQSTLGNTLGRALNTDPLNSFKPECKPPEVAGTDKYELSTCWSELKKTFKCPADSHIYGYKTTSTGYGLYARMEYLGTGTFSNGGNITDCPAGSVCNCFNYRLGP